MLLAVCAAAEGDPQPLGAPEGYHLVWADEFDGDSLDPANWRFETHEPGWVNAELQAYGVYNDCVQVKDGELVIQPIREEDSQGRASYRSGRVNTWGRCEVQYGWIEARLRVPQGQGFLPAFWMMPVNEYLYGQWPKCGEIDIMEVLGHATATNYGTLHFGEPHAQRQGTYTLESGDFATEYHVYALEWTPGEISWYVDGNKYYSTSDWYSATGSTERAYPAPFNQPFYVILNIAVECMFHTRSGADFIALMNVLLFIEAGRVEN